MHFQGCMSWYYSCMSLCWKACCLWFMKCNATCICVVFFKVGEYCRRDALNFSHHPTTPRVCSICFPYHNESPYIIQISSLFAGSSTNRVLVPAFCFLQTALLCLSPRWNVTLMVEVTSWSETRELLILFLEWHVELWGINRKRFNSTVISLFLFCRANREP